ncbi:MAG: hypothetical protein HY909_11260 [Deltaproteobacteria bacterium]|nr:hypothetical protein [Deltaproteobacteria bacterium]
MRALLTAGAALLVACGATVPPADATVADRADSVATPDTRGADASSPEAPVVPPMVCEEGVTEACPGVAPGPCPDLNDGRVHTVSLRGRRNDFRVSCAGTMTSVGPDGVLPLTITTTSDLILTATPLDGDAIVAALSTSAQCATPAGELQCSNGSASVGAAAIFRARALRPGTYYLLLGSARGGDVTVQASLAPSLPRQPGDACPGVMVPANGEPTTFSTRGFIAEPDVGTTCGYGSSGSVGWVDALFQFQITERRDVSITVAASGMGNIQVDVATACGRRAAAIPGCFGGNPVTRRLRDLPPGTYTVVVDSRITEGITRMITATVSTDPPTPPGPAAFCPGVPLTEFTPTSVDVDTLAGGTPLPCVPSQRVGAVLSVRAPTDGRDLLVNFTAPSNRDVVGFQLRQGCDGPEVGACRGPSNRFANNCWARYQGLTPGAPYAVHAGTSSATGELRGRYFQVPHAEPVDVMGNESCPAAVTIPEVGGIFRGSTRGARSLATFTCAGAMTGCGGARAVVYRLDLTAQRRVVAVMAGDFDSLLAIHTGAECPGRSFANACNDDWYGTDAQVDVVLEAGTYWLFAAGCGDGSVGSYTLDVAVLPR